MLEASALYETEPWGYGGDTPFLNQALLLETALDPPALLRETQEIETLLGRVRGEERYGGRTLDVDILFFGERVIRGPELTVPHPRLTQRRFVLVPVTEICPDWLHPVLKVPVRVLLERCEDDHEVMLWEEPFTGGLRRQS